jgi:drug/metabolite transporter (DMT)-like permease
MSVPAAYMGVILIWSTTPLAVQWSLQTDFIFALTARLTLGAATALVLILLLRRKIEWHRLAILGYVIAGTSMYVAMLSMYWALQYIPSGWVSVIFGLSPIMTAVLAWMFLEEGKLNLPSLAGILMGVTALIMIFSSSLNFSPESSAGVAVALFSTFIHSASAVSLKRLKPVKSGLVLSTGAMLVALPLLVITGTFAGTDWTPTLSPREIATIGYLGVIASAFGFSFYYYVLRNVSATRVSLITQITPVSCLILGSWLNNEPLIANVWLGAALIILGLLMYEFGQRRVRRPAKVATSI